MFGRRSTAQGPDGSSRKVTPRRWVEVFAGLRKLPHLLDLCGPFYRRSATGSVEGYSDSASVTLGAIGPRARPSEGWLHCLPRSAGPPAYRSIDDRALTRTGRSCLRPRRSGRKVTGANPALATRKGPLYGPFWSQVQIANAPRWLCDAAAVLRRGDERRSLFLTYPSREPPEAPSSLVPRLGMPREVRCLMTS